MRVGALKFPLPPLPPSFQSRILKLVVDEYPKISSQLNGSLDARSNTAELEEKVSGLEENVEGHPVSFDSFLPSSPSRSS